jgi:deazaflavin-dependent oxidoreductase (nitroreductase family)
MLNWKKLNAEVIAEFRANQGKVARFGDLPLVILHTHGATSGQLREVPLLVVNSDDRMLLFGTAAGSPTHPSWVHDLRARPKIEMEMGVDRFEVEIVELPLDEAQRILDAQAVTSEILRGYQKSAAPRQVPVFVIERVD